MASHFSSPLFTFIVGPNQTVFHVYTSLFSQYVSKPLHTMVHGNMKEAREGTAVLEDVDPEIFGALCEYLMCGDYSRLDNMESVDDEVAEQKGDGISALGLDGWTSYTRC